MAIMTIILITSITVVRGVRRQGPNLVYDKADPHQVAQAGQLLLHRPLWDSNTWLGDEDDRLASDVSWVGAPGRHE
jgi:hypothetical protein